MQRRFWSNRLPGGAIILFVLTEIWNLPGHIDSAQWWKDRLTMLQTSHIAWVLCAIGILLLFRPELVWLWKRAVGRKVHSGDATPITYNLDIPPATGTAFPPSAFERIRRFFLRVIGLGPSRTIPVRGITEIERCQQELVKYIRSQPPDPIGAGHEHVALWEEFKPHIVAACHILDEQAIPRPEIRESVVFEGTAEWGTFLARLLAVRNDVEKARLVHDSMLGAHTHEF